MRRHIFHYLRRVVFIIAVILLSGTIWIAGWQVAHTLFAFTEIDRSITLLYLPAGIRLVILLIASLWGAIGIALAFPLAALQTFPDATLLEITTYSLIAGFIPYATVMGFCRLSGVSRDLATLRPIHLPLLSAAVSVTGALAYASALTAFGRFEESHFLSDATALAAGDFLGCFAVVGLVRMLILWRRKPR